MSGSAAVELSNPGREEEIKLEIPKYEYRKPTEEELASCRCCRIFLVVLFLILLVGLLAAAIVLIATTERCNKRGQKAEVSLAYHIHVPSFFDSDNDGYGDLNGVKLKTNYLKSLGVKTVVLNEADKNEVKSLVDALKDDGISVYLGLPNYVNEDSDWFIASQNGSSKRDWFIWHTNGSVNDWKTSSGSKAWHQAKDGTYFYSYYGKEKPMLNYMNEDVVAAVKAMHKSLMDFGVKGFVLGDVSRLTVDINVVDGDQNQKSSHQVLHKLSTYIRSLGGQVWAITGNSIQDSTEYYGSESMKEADVVVFNQFASMKTFPDASTMNATLTQVFDNTPTYGSSAMIIGGPSYSRAATKLSPDEASFMNLFMMTLPDKYLAYYGDELNMKDNLDGSSTSIMQWNNTLNAGFTKNTSGPYIKLGNDDYKKSNVESKRDGLFNKLAKLRASLESFAKASVEIISTKNNVLLFVHEKKILVIANFGATEVKGINTKNDKIDITEVKVLFSSDKDQIGKGLDLKSIDAPGYYVCVAEITK